MYTGGNVQADVAGNPPQTPGQTAKPSGVWQRIKFWDSQFSVVKGLSVVTLLTGLVGGYFQYLSAYQNKVSIQAKDDMAAATATFLEISNAFAEVQALQQTLYFDFTHAVANKSDASEQSLESKNAQQLSEVYEKARTALREHADVLARKAEIYIDWASDTGRDPAAKRDVNDDPLSRWLLRDYDFNCGAKSTFPQFGTIGGKDAPVTKQSDEDYCAGEAKQADDIDMSPANALARICPRNHNKRAVRIYWYSAKHQVMTMHYCFEAMHDRLEAVRDWASRSDRDKTKESKFLAESAEISTGLDNLAQRLNAFTSLALFQIERIRVKYRPVSFYCSLPLVRDFMNKQCLPIRTATGDNH
jgi:hypothetical protein